MESPQIQDTLANDPPESMLRTFSRHQHLLIQFTRREIEAQTRGSLLGALWWVLQPLLMLGLYTVVFGLVMGGHFEGVESAGRFDYSLGIFIGLSLLGLITETMGQSPHAIVSQPNLVHKVRFPTEILSVAQVGAATVRMLVSLVLSLLGLILFDGALSWSVLLLPIIVFPVFLMAIGLGWLLSAIGVYVRDSPQIMLFLSTFIFYTSAVFYAAASIPEPIFRYLRFNPILHAVEETRNLLLWESHPVDWGNVAYIYLWSVALLAVGWFTFQRLKHSFADVL